MTAAYYSRRRLNGQSDLLRRSKSGRWRCYRLDRAEWFVLTPPLAKAMERNLRDGALCRVAAVVLDGCRVA